MVWKGTSFDKLFSTVNLLVMFFLAVLCTTMTVFALVKAQVLVPKENSEMSRYFKFFKMDVLLINVVNFLNQFLVIMQFVYYGSVKGSFDADSNQLAAEQDSVDRVKANEELLKDLHE